MLQFLMGLGLVPLLSAVFLFVAIVLIVVSAGAMLTEQEFFQRRLAFTPGANSTSRGPSIILEDGLLKQFEELVTPKNLAELSTIRKRLAQAGHRRPSAVRVFYAAKAGFALGFAILSAVVVPFFASSLPLPLIGALIVTGLLIGYMIPSFWIQRTIEYRRLEAEQGFPDLLDMLLICMEAGSSLDQASRRVAREIRKVSKVLADELSVINEELFAGKGRAAVFRDFADRVAVQDISSFSAVLRQSDEFGVSIADTLRVYASELRNKRIMRAEEKANMMPVKLALGSIAFTIPPTMLIMGGPSVIMILRTFAGLGGH